MALASVMVVDDDQFIQTTLSHALFGLDFTIAEFLGALRSAGRL